MSNVAAGAAPVSDLLHVTFITAPCRAATSGSTAGSSRGVTSTGIYCRPAARRMTPKRENVRFHPTAGGRAGGRLPGLQALPARRDPGLAGMGPAGRPGRPGDAADRRRRRRPRGRRRAGRRLGYSERHLHRQLARRGRRRAARGRPGAAGADRPGAARDDRAADHRRRVRGRVRQRPPVQRRRSARSSRCTPTQLRGRARRPRPAAATGAIVLRLPYRAPIDLRRAARLPRRPRGAGGRGGRPAATYRRRCGCRTGPASLALATCRRARLALRAAADRPARPRRGGAALPRGCSTSTPTRPRSTTSSAPTRCSARWCASAPGLRVPGHVDGHELAVRAVLGQQVSVAGRRAPLAGTLTAGVRRAAAGADGPVTRLFPTPAALPARTGGLAMPAARAARCCGLAAALARRRRRAATPGRPRRAPSGRCWRCPASGRGPPPTWRCGRCGDPDVFLPTDLGVRHALNRAVGRDPPRRAALAERWRPWRSYALLQLWHSLLTGRTSHVSWFPPGDPACSGPWSTPRSTRC